MAKFYCNNCYKTFEVEVMTPPVLEAGEKCPHCGSTWTTYISKNPPLEFIVKYARKDPPPWAGEYPDLSPYRKQSPLTS